MNILSELKQRFKTALPELVEDADELLEMIRPAQDAKFGDYQANFSMPLGKRLGRAPREIAAEIVEKVELDDLCQNVEVAGPGFINLQLADSWILKQLTEALVDPRLGVEECEPKQTFVIDYSSPNVAKPMHVGHIRSTVIGDALCRTLRFLGNRVISDNHLGDWGTQFGMIIYGYRHFGDEQAYQKSPIDELAGIYKLVRRLMDYHEGREKLPELEKTLARQQAEIEAEEAAEASTDKAVEKKKAKALRKRKGQLADSRTAIESLKKQLAEVEADEKLSAAALQHENISEAVLQETAKLHAGDPENLRLWQEFLPKCREDIQRVYNRLNIRFDVEYGESFYHDRLAQVVEDLEKQGLSRESDGATCVFLEEYSTPMIIRKKDGAYLYATTDLATIAYRMETWQPDAILYVVDHRQGEHFGKLFTTVKKWGYDQVELQHISFGTVLGDDGRPFKTRAGDTVGLEGLLDEAVSRAAKVVDSNDDGKPDGSDLSERQRQHIAEVVGIAALKYADLSQNRTSDYTFSYDKMLALNGNTATYMQYAYARVRNIFTRGNIDVEDLLASSAKIDLSHAAERALGLSILRFSEALELVVADYRPNQLTSYLFELAETFSTFYQNCPVLKAENEEQKTSRLLLCDLCARTLRQGLELLGIDVIEKM